MSVMRDLSVAEAMWTAYESQAEQQYQAIHGPGSPSRQAGSSSVTPSKGSHIWLAIRSLSRTHHWAAFHHQATGAAGIVNASFSTANKGRASISAPQQMMASGSDAGGDEEQQLQSSSGPSTSAAQLQLVQAPAAQRLSESFSQGPAAALRAQHQHEQHHAQQQGLHPAAPVPGNVSATAKGDLL
jgi:hypothetical protein